jgi:hypothetical protein
LIYFVHVFQNDSFQFLFDRCSHKLQRSFIKTFVRLVCMHMIFLRDTTVLDLLPLFASFSPHDSSKELAKILEI